LRHAVVARNSNEVEGVTVSGGAKVVELGGEGVALWRLLHPDTATATIRTAQVRRTPI
jgi:hypothetical protein